MSIFLRKIDSTVAVPVYTIWENARPFGAGLIYDQPASQPVKRKAPALQKFRGEPGLLNLQRRSYLMVNGMVVNCSAAVTPLLVCAQTVSV